MSKLNPPKNHRQVITRTCSTCHYLCRVKFSDDPIDSTETGCFRNGEDDYGLPDEAESIHWAVCDYYKRADFRKGRDGKLVRHGMIEVEL